MAGIIMDGKHLAGMIEEDLATRVSDLKTRYDFTPVLATILVGDDPSSEIYVNMKGNACQRVGIESMKIKLPQTTTTDDLADIIRELNADCRVSGILLQHPVPAQIDESRCFNTIDIEKDVDGVTSAGFGKMSLNQPAYLFRDSLWYHEVAGLL